MRRLRLGLIGDRIGPSRSPALHRICGDLAGIAVAYDLLMPPVLGRSFEDVLAEALITRDGFNVTLPYKERVLSHLSLPDRAVARIGAVNTVCTHLGMGGLAEGHNTDHTGFIAAWRAAFGAGPAGRVALFGAGGVGKAIGFALLRLGAAEIGIIDPDAAKAGALAAALNAAAAEAGQPPPARVAPPEALGSADGVVNATPLGMAGHPGSPLPEEVAFPRDAWAFDAVYTPAETPFRASAMAAGAGFLPGWELFFHQGLDAFRLFTGVAIDTPAEVRRRLLAADQHPGLSRPPRAMPGEGVRFAAFHGVPRASIFLLK